MKSIKDYTSIYNQLKMGLPPVLSSQNDLMTSLRMSMVEIN